LYYLIKEKPVAPSDEENNVREAKIDKLVFKLQSNYQHFSILIGDFAKNVAKFHDSIEQKEIDSVFKMPLYGQLYDSFDLFVQEAFQI